MAEPKYLDASFRGVPFEVDEHEMPVGRENVIHTYAQKDKARVDDMGRNIEPFTIRGYVIGDDYQTLRDALIDALNKEGSGVLIHPWFGTMTVHAMPGKCREDSQRRNMAVFEMVFIEAGDYQYSNPSVTVSALQSMSGAAATAVEDAESAFDQFWNIQNQAAWVLNDALDQINSRIESITAVINKWGDPTILSTVKSALFTLQANLIIWADDPTLFTSTAVAEAWRAVFIGVTQGDTLLAVTMGEQWAISKAAADDTTLPEEELQRRRNVAGLDLLLTVSALSACATSMAELTYASYDEAMLAASKYSDASTDAEDLADDVDLYNSMVNLRTLFVGIIQTEAADLPRLITWTPPQVECALVLSQLWYGTGDRADEITERNGAEHPGFVAPRPILMLSR